MKRMFTVMAILAVLNLTLLAGLGGYAWRQGWLTPERVELAVAALRGETSEDETTDEEDTSGAARPVVSDDRFVRGEQTVRIRRAELSRREREIEHAWQYLESQQLAFLKEKESFDDFRKRTADEAAERDKRTGDDGWQRELKYYGTVKAKLAKQLLRGKPDADVVRVMLGLNARQGKKIIEQCKTAEEREWIGRILSMLRDSNAAQAEALVAGTTTNRGA